MDVFFHVLQSRNALLSIFGWCNMLGALALLPFTFSSKGSFNATNAWLKPFKFALSIGFFSWTMAWYAYYLNASAQVGIYSWAIVILLGFEVIYIALQAGKRQLSHYNTSSAGYSILTALMAVAAIAVTLWTGYIGILFFTADLSNLPGYYVLSIRTGIFLFVIFAFQGASMGARSAHTVGAADGGQGLPLVKWSTRYGDLRIAHFIGMHGLQVMPLLAWYVLKDTRAVAIMGLLYAVLAIFTLVKALQGKPLVRYRVVERPA